MLARLRKRLGDERGFTLVELLAALSIGTIVMMAAFYTLDRAGQVQREAADRADALQRGRISLELVTRQLRSQVCLGTATEPITDGRATSVEFYADLTDGSDANKIEKRRISYDADKKTLVEYRYTASGTYPDLVFSSTPATTRVIGSGIVPQKVGTVNQPIFTYYAWEDAATPGAMTQLTATDSTPLSLTDVGRTIMVKVAFVAQPIRYKTTPKDRDSATLENQAYVRSADPMKPKEGAKCL
jgi:prepilin-type N-terminal cleavage/methylation domain-containing protein